MELSLIIEKAEDSRLWGRVMYDDNLLVDTADNIDKLKQQLQQLLWDFHNVGELILSCVTI